MALTRITRGVIKPNENYDTHNINSTGIVTAIGLDINGNGDISGNLSVGGVLTYEDVTSIDSVGIITAQKDIHVGAGVSAVGIGTFGGLVSPYADIDDFIDVGSNIQLGNAGVVTATTFKGNGDFVDIDVDGHTNLDNVSVTGISTFGVSGISNPFQSDWATKSMINLYGSYGGGLSFNDNGNNGYQLFTTSAGVNFFIKNAAVGGTPKTSIKCVKDAGVHLYNNNIEKAYTNSQGLYVTNTSADAILRTLAPSGYHSKIDMTADAGSAHGDNYRLEVNTDQKFRVYGKNTNGNYTSFIELDQAGRVTLTRDVDVARHLDVDGHTELDNLRVTGVTTFTSGNVQLASDSQRLQLGSAQDLWMYHTGTSGGGHGLIQNEYGIMYMLSAGWEYRHYGTNQTTFKINNNGNVTLYYQGSGKLSSTSYGAQIDTILRLYGAAGSGGGRLRLAEGAAYSEIRGVRNTDTSSELWFGTEISDTVDYRAKINTGGHFIPGTDSTYDLGITGTRWRNVYADTLYGDGSNLTGIAADKIFEGNTEVETVDTGSNGHVKITTEGDERLRITSTGNVNIGTSELDQTVSGRLLNVYGGQIRARQTTSGNTLEAFGHTTSGQSYGLLVNAGTTANDYAANFRNSGGTTLFRIRGDGNIGINESSPGTKLHIKGSGEILRLETTASGGGQCYIDFDDETATRASIGMRGSSSDTLTMAALNGGLRFDTSGKVQAMNIAADGKVGINQASPATYQLEVVGSFAATTKSFVIDHPTKEKHKLRYACLEGPENSVYVRGKTSDSVIELPDYWTGLVHEDSITVNVTPIGNHKVWVESINNNSVTIGSDGSEYFYTVFAERKDVDKLEVEVAN